MVAYPPAVPPSTRTDSTTSATTHAADHNMDAAALAAIIAILGAAPQGGYADLTARLEGLLSEIIARVGDTYTPLGAVTTAVQAYVASLVNLGIAQPLPAESELSAALGVDSAGRAALRIDLDGNILGTFVLQSGAVDFAQLSASLLAAVPGSLPPESEMSWAVLNPANGQAPVYVDLDGNLVVTGITLPAGSIAAAQLTVDTQARLFPAVRDRTTTDTTGTTPNRKVWADRSDGSRVQVSTTGVDSSNPAYRPDADAVFFDTPAGRMWAPADGSAPPAPSQSSTDIAAWGDSLTYGVADDDGTHPYTAALATALGVAVSNQGGPGQASTDIAMRQGAVQPVFSFPGNSIPNNTASNPVTLVAPLSSFRTTGSSNFSYHGTIAGVPGILGHIQGTPDSWTFKRDAATGAVAVPAGGAPFTMTDGDAFRASTQVLWVGRNNLTGALLLSDVTRDVAAMAAYLTPFTKRFLVVGVTDQLTEVNGTAAHTLIVAQNAAMAAAYGKRFLDVRRYLIDNYAAICAAASITPTSQDATDAANDVVPTSLRANQAATSGGKDPLHFAPFTYDAIGNKIASTLQALGWYSA